MRTFEHGVGVNYSTGEIRIYMTKPKNMDGKISGQIRVIGHTFTPDEFINKRGVRMLSFTTIAHTTDVSAFAQIARAKLKKSIEVICKNAKLIAK